MKTTFAILCGIELATGAWFTAFLCFVVVCTIATSQMFDEWDRRDEADHKARLAAIDAEYQARRERIPPALRTR